LSAGQNDHLRDKSGAYLEAPRLIGTRAPFFGTSDPLGFGIQVVISLQAPAAKVTPVAKHHLQTKGIDLRRPKYRDKLSSLSLRVPSYYL
jgi:hypothetical protein